MSDGLIRIRGARQHNLKNLDLDLRTAELTVVTGPSGSGKSSLVFDTLYAEGQRRYVETFSAYARQFLDRMDRPAVDKVDGVPPAIAIDQTNPVRTSRSTVGTMTELNDHLKLLYARAAELFDRKTALPVRHDTAQSIYAELLARSQGAGDPRMVLTFPVELPANTSAEQVEQWLSASGFTRVQAEREVEGKKVLDVVADRFRIQGADKQRAMEAIELSLKRGAGRLAVYVGDEGGTLWRFSTGLHCPESDIRYADPQPALFSFNSAFGACEACRGFGRVIGVDLGLVIPDERKTLRNGAIKPMQTPAWKDCQDDLLKYAGEAGIPRDTPWKDLSPGHREWVINGTPNWNGNWNKQWYGVKRFFDYLESKAYKMHIRVLLSKYRSYTECPACHGARLKLEALLWRVGSKALADAALPAGQRFLPVGVDWTREQLEALPGLSLHDLMQLPIQRLRDFVDGLQLPSTMLDEALKLLLDEIRHRSRYLCDVGLGYLTLDRQSRTLSGGEVQRINLTTALGTSLVNTLFVLDEPSIGLHPRDMGRIVQAMQRLRDAGNTLVVVEHDPAVMLAADRLIDMGPGPGERGGQIVFDGTPESIRAADTLTGAYLGARKHVGMGLKRPVEENTPKLILQGVREHNLKDVSVEFPLQRLVVVTGVSGSGKSTLMQDVLYPALARQFGKATETPGVRGAARRGLPGRRGVRRPVAHRQDRALQPGQLCRRLRRDPQAVRRRPGGARAQLHGGHVQLQRRRRPLPDLRRLGLRACRDAVPQRRLPALPGLRWQALPRRDAGREAEPEGPRPERGRCAGADRRRGGAPVQRPPHRHRQAAAHRRRGPGVRAPGPAGADAVGRRGAAPQACRLPGRGREQPALRRGQEGHAVPVRRADHRPAFRRHRQADARAAQAAGRGPFADRHRAQPRRHPRGGLAHRPGPGRRRGRRRGRLRRHAGGDRQARQLAHRRRAARLRAAHGPPRDGRGRRPAAAVHRARAPPGRRGDQDRQRP
jgi:excinuclease ABC A subunit